MFRYAPENSGLFWLHDLFWLAIVIALVIGTFLVVRAVLSRPIPQRPQFAAGAGMPAPNPVHELDLRYARGEVGRDEYLQRRSDLTGQPPPPGPTAPPA